MACSLSTTSFLRLSLTGRCRAQYLLTQPHLLLSSGYAYFLRGHLYWKFDPVKVKVLEGFPRLIGPDFFDCAEPANTFR